MPVRIAYRREMPIIRNLIGDATGSKCLRRHALAGEDAVEMMSVDSSACAFATIPENFVRTDEGRRAGIGPRGENVGVTSKMNCSLLFLLLHR